MSEATVFQVPARQRVFTSQPPRGADMADDLDPVATVRRTTEDDDVWAIDFRRENLFTDSLPLTSATVTSSDPALVVSAVTFSGTVVTFTVSGGVEGQTYRVCVKPVRSDGRAVVRSLEFITQGCGAEIPEAATGTITVTVTKVGQVPPEVVGRYVTINGFAGPTNGSGVVSFPTTPVGVGVRVNCATPGAESAVWASDDGTPGGLDAGGFGFDATAVVLEGATTAVAFTLT